MHDGVPATTVAVYWRRFVNATSVGSVKALSKESKSDDQDFTQTLPQEVGHKENQRAPKPLT